MAVHWSCNNFTKIADGFLFYGGLIAEVHWSCNNFADGFSYYSTSDRCFLRLTVVDTNLIYRRTVKDKLL